jgi:hypothetical protein
MTTADRPTDEQFTAACEIIREWDRARLAGTGPACRINLDDLLNALDEKFDFEFTTPDMWRLANLIGDLMNDPDFITSIDTTWIEFEWYPGPQQPAEVTP